MIPILEVCGLFKYGGLLLLNDNDNDDDDGGVCVVKVKFVDRNESVDVFVNDECTTCGWSELNLG